MGWSYTQDDIAKLNEVLGEMNRYTTKLLPDLIAHQAKEFADDCFLATPRANVAEIKAKLDSLGYRFIRAPVAYANRIGRQSAKGRKSKIEAERYAAYNYRKSRIGYLAATWIPAMQALGSKMKVAQGGIRGRKYSSVRFEQMNGEPGESASGSYVAIEVINTAPGVVVVDERTGFMRAALLDRIEDMQAYIDKKMDEYSHIFNKQGYLTQGVAS